MSTPFESLNETFNITSETELVTDIVEEKEADLVSGSKTEDREDDYQYARGQLHSIIEKMQVTLEGAMEVAQESDHPRAFEVAFNGAKHLADVVDKLQDLHKKEKAISEEQPSSSSGQVNHGTVNNVYMTGTTNDMLRMLKDAQNEDSDK